MKNLFTLLILFPFISNAQTLQNPVIPEIHLERIAAGIKQNSGSAIGGLNRENSEILVANATTVKISGPDNVCLYITNLTTATYSINKVFNVASYNWGVPAGAIITSHPGGAGINDTAITVSFNAAFVDLSTINVGFLSFLGRPVSGSILISRKQPVFPDVIAGPVNICSFIYAQTNLLVTKAIYSISKVDFALSYIWEVPVGAVIESHPAGIGENDTCILVSYSTEFNVSGYIRVTAVNECGKSGARALNVKMILPIVPAMIYGPINACNNIFSGTDTTFYINSVPFANSYKWFLSDTINAHIISHPATGENDTAIIVHFDNNYFAGTVCVQSGSNCGFSIARKLFVAKRVPTIPSISGSDNLCGSRGVATTASAYTGAYRSQVYSAFSGNTSYYLWNIPAGTTGVLSQGTATITVFFPPDYTEGTISVRAVSACGTTPMNSIDVTGCNIAPRGGVSKGNTNLIKENELSIFPNPASGNFTIKINPAFTADKVLVEIINGFGQTVYQRTEKNIKGNFIIPVNNTFPNGIYMVHYQLGAEKITKRLVISR